MRSLFILAAAVHALQVEDKQSDLLTPDITDDETVEWWRKWKRNKKKCKPGYVRKWWGCKKARRRHRRRTGCPKGTENRHGKCRKIQPKPKVVELKCKSGYKKVGKRCEKIIHKCPFGTRRINGKGKCVGFGPPAKRHPAKKRLGRRYVPKRTYRPPVSKTLSSAEKADFEKLKDTLKKCQDPNRDKKYNRLMCEGTIWNMNKFLRRHRNKKLSVNGDLLKMKKIAKRVVKKVAPKADPFGDPWLKRQSVWLKRLVHEAIRCSFKKTHLSYHHCKGINRKLNQWWLRRMVPSKYRKF